MHCSYDSKAGHLNPRSIPTGWMIAAAVTMLLALPWATQAKVIVSGIFGSNMVLQQEMAVPVWGTADAGEEVTVTFADQTLKTKADAKGKWMVKLTAMKATANQKGQTLTVTGSKTIKKFDDVLIGEVWLCSGQSNMAFTVPSADDSTNEIKAANFPQIRMITVDRVRTARDPLDTMGGNWRVCEPKSVANYSAVAYFFGRDLHQKLGVPVGLINSSVGGTVAQAWTSGDALHKTMPEYDRQYQELVRPGHVLDQKIEAFETASKIYDASMKQLAAAEADMDAAAKYAAADFDDSSWKTMKVPGNWSGNGLPKNAQGMVWIRKTIDLPASMAGKDLLLRLGMVSSVDTAWFNGQQVGETGSIAKRDWNRSRVVREYRVPAKLVKAGKNVIALRVSSLRYGGGLLSSPKENIDVCLADAPKDKATQVSLQGEWRFLQVVEMSGPPSDPQSPNRPSILFNGMIHPLIPYAIRGAIWYQGESNSSAPQLYQRLLTTLITDWRGRWGQGDFPFLIVQLPNFKAVSSRPTGDSWTMLREAQADVARTVPNTGLAVTLDVGEANNIHPRNKQDVGKRLALIALATTYGKDVVYQGPTFKSLQRKGSEVHVSFDHAAGGLVQKGDKLEGFGLAGKDGQWVWADAKIVGDQVVVSSDKVKEPAAVSYDWSSNPPATLFNKAGLPASQFNHEVK